MSTGPIHSRVRVTLAADEAAGWIAELCGVASLMEIKTAQVTAVTMLAALLDMSDAPADEFLRSAMERACDLGDVGVSLLRTYELATTHRTIH